MPQNITSEEDLVSWIQDVFPLFTQDDVSKVLRYYPGSNATDDMNAADYATLGYTGATAINVSSIATGQQQRANVSNMDPTSERVLTINRTSTPR